MKHDFHSIKNKEIVAVLSRKLNLGAENVIARIAYTYSLSKNIRLELSEIEDSRGKEYTKYVLFGDYYNFYIALLCNTYQISKTDKNIPKYIKMHIDNGLELISEELKTNPNLTGFDYLIDKISDGLKDIQ